MNSKLTAGVCAALALSAAPTALLDPVTRYARLLEEVRSRHSSPTVLPRDELQLLQIPASATETSLAPAESVLSRQASRDTTPREHAIGEFRRWEQLPANWDGEGAAAPNVASLREASNFACLRAAGSEIEPMLHASGRAGLCFRTATLYADVEFFGDGRASYFIERNGDRHKGVINFDSKTMPAVLETLLQA